MKEMLWNFCLMFRIKKMKKLQKQLPVFYETAHAELVIKINNANNFICRLEKFFLIIINHYSVILHKE